ncbi:unnamed protein product [Linum tenue]|uniref:Uncharacterized protein n=1 Tax=Linum tenue TaxID=586396 RepID=A0AAV0Q806_9ROSI|nr:unnamed protein product [Linum tenue]
MAETLVFSTEVMIPWATVRIFSAETAALVGPLLVKPNDITFWVWVSTSLSEAGNLKLTTFMNVDAGTTLERDETPTTAVAPAPTATTGLLGNSHHLLLSSSWFEASPRELQSVMSCPIRPLISREHEQGVLETSLQLGDLRSWSLISQAASIFPLVNDQHCLGQFLILQRLSGRSRSNGYMD